MSGRMRTNLPSMKKVARVPERWRTSSSSSVERLLGLSSYDWNRVIDRLEFLYQELLTSECTVEVPTTGRARRAAEGDLLRG